MATKWVHYFRYTRPTSKITVHFRNSLMLFVYVFLTTSPNVKYEPKMLVLVATTSPVREQDVHKFKLDQQYG